MHIIICGSRTYSDRSYMDKVLNDIFGDATLVIDGKANGADTLGHLWATDHGIRTIRVPADWNLHGKSAGPKRNAQMLQHLLHSKSKGYDIAVVAFVDKPLSMSRGTYNMVSIAKKHGVDTFVHPDKFNR